MDADAVRGAAAALFVDCFPLVLTDVVRVHHPVGGHHFRLLTDEASALAPGLDEQDELMVLTSAWVDLTDGPVVVSLPHTAGRFFNLTLIDTSGEPFAGLGTRTGDDAGLNLALVGPRWEGELPHGVRAKRTPCELLWIVSRIRAHSALDLAETVAVAKRQGLAALRGAREMPEPTVSASEPPCPPCLRQVVEMPPTVFFHRLDAIVERAPAARQKALRPRIAALRAELGGPARAEDWNPEFAAALTGGFADAVEAIRSAATASDAGGWRELGDGSSAADADALSRAAQAFASLGASLRDDLLGLACDRDDAGLPLSGEQQYRLHFARSGLPPAHAFWRLFALPPARGDHRHGIGDRSDPAPNEDGSLDIVLQRHAPEPTLLSNWLPLPEGRLSLLMRLFSPAAQALGGSWRMPTPERVPTAGRRAWSSALPAADPDVGDISTQPDQLGG
jgi:hypothetical protein